jgi:hypothetical protein
MYNKHAVWRQCASVIPIVMALATTLSIQSITFSNDVYWAIVLWTSTTIQFMAAEHGSFYFTTDTWQKLQQYREFVIRCMMTTWSLVGLDISQHLMLVVLFCVCSLFLQRYYNFTLLPVLLWNIVTLNLIQWIPVYFVLTYLRERMFEKSIGTSLASPPIRQAYGLSTALIVIESIILWSLRCQYRFPYTFRWTPFIASGVGCFVASAWCSISIQDTKVSRNAIIKKRGHGMAASLTAAENCPVCCKCLTSLDMEASFG